MNYKDRLSCIFFILFLLVISSCTNFFTTIHQQKDQASTLLQENPDEKVMVKISFKDLYTSRAITSDSLVPDSYTFNFVSNTDAVNTFTQSLLVSTEYNIELEIGDNYTLIIEGYNNTTLVCETSSPYTFTVQPGGILDPSPVIEMIPAGTGNLEVTYSWAPDSITDITATLIDSEMNPVAGSLTVTPNYAEKTVAIITSSSLPVGYYVLTVNFSDADGVILSYKESVTIKAGQTSTSDKAAAGTVNLGQSWFAVPPPEVQDAYYIVAPNGDFTVVWRDESESAVLSYAVSYTTATGFGTIDVTTPLGDNTHALKISGLAESVETVSVKALNAAGSNTGTEVNSNIRFQTDVYYGGTPYTTDYYFEMGSDITLTPDISWSLIDYPDVTNSSVVVEFSGTTYTVPQAAGTSIISTNFANPSVDLTLYTIKMLPQGQLFVSSGGNDSNSGTSNTTTDALATVSEAVTRLTDAHVTSALYTINVDGTHDLTSSIIINASAVPPLRIDGGTTATNITSGEDFPLFEISDVSGTLTIRNFTLSNSNYTSGNGAAISKYGASELKLENVIIDNCSAPNGGAIYINGSNVTLTGCTIQNCTATGNGGGIYIDGGEVTLNNCVIGRNIGETASAVGNYIGSYGYPDETTASNKAGGGAGIYLNSGSLEINDSHISYNRTTTYAGGGIYIKAGDIEVNGSFICGNVGKFSGGGIGCANVSPIPYAKISNSNIWYNSTGSYQGGGIFCADLEISNSEISYNTSGLGAGIYTWKASITDCSINNNTATSSGGGIYKLGIDTLSITGSTTFNGNQAADGGALYQNAGTTNFSEYSGSITSNSASNSGGAFYIEGGKLTIQNANINGCSSQTNGGAIYSNNSSLTIEGTTISGCSVTGNGGAIYKTGTGDLVVQESINDSSYITGNHATTGSGGGIYFAGTGDFTVSSADISNNTANVMGGGIVVFNGSSGTYNFSGIMNDNRSPNGSAVSFGANLTATARLNLVMNGYNYNQTNQNPVVFVDADNSGLTLNISPDTKITDEGHGPQYAGYIYLSQPAKITVTAQLNNEIILDTNDYNYYNDLTKIIVDGVTTNISVIDHTLNGNGYID